MNLPSIAKKFIFIKKSQNLTISLQSIRILHIYFFYSPYQWNFLCIYVEYHLCIFMHSEIFFDQNFEARKHTYKLFQSLKNNEVHLSTGGEGKKIFFQI